MQAMPVARMQELERQVRQIGRARKAEVVLGALAEQQPRLIVVVLRAVGQELRERRTGVRQLPGVDLDDAAEPEPAGVAGKADEGDFGNDFADPWSARAVSPFASPRDAVALRHPLVGDQAAQLRLVLDQVLVEPLADRVAVVRLGGDECRGNATTVRIVVMVSRIEAERFVLDNRTIPLRNALLRPGAAAPRD